MKTFTNLDYTPSRVDSVDFTFKDGDIVICEGGLVVLNDMGVNYLLRKVNMKGYDCLDSIILGDIKILEYKLERYFRGEVKVLETLPSKIVYHVANIKDLGLDKLRSI